MTSDSSQILVFKSRHEERPSASAVEHERAWSDVWLKFLSIFILMLGLVIIAYPFVRQYVSGLEQNRLAQASSRAVSNWPYPQAEVALKNARAYNAALVQSGQPVMGEAVDPFRGKQSSAQTESEKDTQYQSLLNQGDGIMGSVFIPKISVDLPVYHGTSQESLASGAGHLYGTSLPVGGKSTHTVITGHRGLVNALMFTRLDELKRGDPFYIKSMNRTIAYRVDRIKVIEPDDTSSLRIEPGVDRATLMTCTPYGVNTHRLLVSGVRAEMPVPVPYPKDAKKDSRFVVFVTLAFMVVFSLVTFFLLDNKKAIIAHHMRPVSK